jgi:hypothetical protein
MAGTTRPLPFGAHSGAPAGAFARQITPRDLPRRTTAAGWGAHSARTYGNFDRAEPVEPVEPPTVGGGIWLGPQRIDLSHVRALQLADDEALLLLAAIRVAGLN